MIAPPPGRLIVPIATHPELEGARAALRGLAREFAGDRLAPGAAERDRTGVFPWELYREAAGLGLVGVDLPEALGGGGLGLLENCLVLEELARADGSFALTVAASAGLCGGHLARAGSEEQRARWVPPLARGAIGAWALTEPGAGSDAAALRCRAARTGEGWILDGAKTFITGGSDFAAMVVMARTGEGRRGISAFVVEEDDPGRESRPLRGKLGMRSSDTSEVVFSGCRIPADRLLGAEGEGFAQAMDAVTRGRAGVGAMAAGLGQAALDASCAYAREREAFGRPLAGFAGLRAMLADGAIDLAAARELVWGAARRADAGEEYRREASAAKLFASEAALRACDRAIQLHGGAGYLDETPAGRLWRDARLLTIGEGTSEIQRGLIARALFA